MLEISKTVRILSLDGGGMRAVMQAAFLEEFQERLGIAATESLADYFDLIIGTSMGGIQATCYAAGKSPQEFKELLTNFGQHIFTTDFEFHGEGETPDQDIVPDMTMEHAAIRATDKDYLQRLYYQENLTDESLDYVKPYLYSNRNLKIKLQNVK